MEQRGQIILDENYWPLWLVHHFLWGPYGRNINAIMAACDFFRNLRDPYDCH